MGLATLPSTLKPLRRYRNVGLRYNLLSCLLSIAHSCFTTRQFSDNQSILYCNGTTLSAHPSLIEICADRNTNSRSNLHNETYTIESIRRILYDGIDMTESTRWNPHDGIYTTHPHDAIMYKGHKDHDIHERHGSRKGS